MDLLESPLFNPPIILLQTVMEEVRHRSLPLHKRLKALLKLEEKRVWIFYNEFRKQVVLVVICRQECLMVVLEFLQRNCSLPRR
jgi:exosome complex exonuclease DIS3/RRP44